MPTKPISPLAPLAPPDIQSEAARLAEAQAIAQLLLQDSMTPSETMTNLGGGVQMANWGEMLGKAVQGMGARKQLASAREGQSALGAKYQEDLSKEVGKFRELSQRDKAAAITMALMSPFKELRSYGEEMEKGMVTPAQQMQHGYRYDPKAVPDFVASGQGVLPGAPEVKFSDEQAFRVQDGQVTGSFPTSTYGGMTTSQGVPGQFRKETNKFTGTTGGNLTPAGARGRGEIEGFQKKLQEGGKMYEEGIKSLGVIGQLQSDLNRIPADKMGSLAAIRNAWSKFAELISGSPEESTRLLEQVQAGSGQLMLEKIRLVAPVTKDDIVVIKGIVGSEGMSKDSLSRVLQILAQRNMDEMRRHEKFTERYAADSENEDLVREAYTPEFTTRPVSGPVTPSAPRPSTTGTTKMIFDAEGNLVPAK